MVGLKTYLDAIVTNATTATVVVMFDKITTEVIGGASSDTTTTPGDFTTDVGAYTAANFATAADNAANHYMVLYLRPVAGTSTTYDADVVANQAITYVFDVNRVNNTLADVALADGEGFGITYATSQSLSFDDGDAYTSAANGLTVQTVDDLVAYMNADTTLDAVGIDVQASRAGFEETYITVNYLVASGTAASATSSSTAGFVNATFGTDENGTTAVLSMRFAAAANQATLANALMTAIDGTNLWAAATVTSSNSNQFVVTRRISETGYADQDISPIAQNVPSVSFVLDTAMTSTTMVLIPSSFDALFDTASNAGGYSNLNGTTTTSNTPVFSLYTSASAKTGIAIILKNTGTTAFNSAVTLTVDAESNTAIVAETATLTLGSGVNGLLRSGVNMQSSSLITSTSATDSTKPSYWVAAHTAVTDGNPVTSSTQTAITCDRTQWLG